MWLVIANSTTPSTTQTCTTHSAASGWNATVKHASALVVNTMATTSTVDWIFWNYTPTRTTRFNAIVQWCRTTKCSTAIVIKPRACLIIICCDLSHLNRRINCINKQMGINMKRYKMFSFVAWIKTIPNHRHLIVIGTMFQVRPQIECLCSGIRIIQFFIQLHRGHINWYFRCTLDLKWTNTVIGTAFRFCNRLSCLNIKLIIKGCTITPCGWIVAIIKIAIVAITTLNATRNRIFKTFSTFFTLQRAHAIIIRITIPLANSAFVIACTTITSYILQLTSLTTETPLVRRRSSINTGTAFTWKIPSFCSIIVVITKFPPRVRTAIVF